MTINLNSSDFEAITKKVSSILKSNRPNQIFFSTKVERYGIPFKVSIYEENQNHYVIEEVSYYGVNTNNICVSYDNSTMELFGNIFI